MAFLRPLLIAPVHSGYRDYGGVKRVFGVGTRGGAGDGNYDYSDYLVCVGRCHKKLCRTPCEKGSYALGATQSETIRRVVVPAALSGIGSAFLLAISRALGETMIVVMAAGLAANLTFNPLRIGHYCHCSDCDSAHGRPRV